MRYGLLFTCMASRAISDQGTNFVGARRELKQVLDKFNHIKIGSELQHHGRDWSVFKLNVPSASHVKLV